MWAAVEGPPSPLAHFVCFAAFRVFDIAKVPPARQLEALPGARGIMLDDVAAGVWAGVVMLLIGRFAAL